MAARVLRRVLRNDLEISSPLIKLPHQKTYVIDRDRLLWLVARDELGAAPNAVLPARLILIARPEGELAGRFDSRGLWRYYWRLNYHARIDFQMRDATAPLRMSTAMLRQRINRIGQIEFDEIRAVLRQEAMLIHPDSEREIYAEFVAVFCELDQFAPELLPLYFPALRELEDIRNLIREDCSPAELLEASTPSELRDQSASEHPRAGEAGRPQASRPAVVAKPSEWRCRQRVRRGERLREQGNSVRAALRFQQALAVAPVDRVEEICRSRDAELDTLVQRLQSALELTDELATTWRRIAGEVLSEATRGFWNANTRLLYDLQKVCLDHERETYRIDLWKWLRSFGREPLKRPLPNQRIVLMSKHLYSATQRLGSVRINPDDRRELSRLLHESAAAAERLLRRRLEPFLAHSLHDVGFVPGAVVEEVAFEKLVEELLDGVNQRGFLTLGDLRDAVSRNQLKMPDLTGSGEFFSGDALLRADQRLALLLDGVYHKGPFYLRWLQRLSSLAFGTVWGRHITLFLALPYGSAFMAIRGAEHLVEMFRTATGQSEPSPEPKGSQAASPGAQQESASATKEEDQSQSVVAVEGADGAADASPPVDEAAVSVEPPTEDVASLVNLPDHLTHPPHESLLSTEQLWLLVLLLGTVIFVLINFPRFRVGLMRAMSVVWSGLRLAFYVIPLAVLKFPPVAWLMRSLPVMLFRRYLLTPLLLTVLYGRVLPWLHLTPQPSDLYVGIFFVVTVAVFLSRLGRDTEELFRDWMGRTWYRVRVHLIFGFFTLIVDVFRQVMDGLERVLYAVDEWLRFRKGESNITLAGKALLGAVWSVVQGVIRFAVTLLIEPQINPIKHFPVVTVSHKLLVFMIPHFAMVLSNFLPRAWAGTLATLVITGIPGIFGFLAWEFKENWKLYAANRPRRLRPVRVGSHGETVARLMCPGFHSGTIPKLFAKRRRNARKALLRPEDDRRAKFDEQLHHVGESIQHFIERELLNLLQQSRAFAGVPLSVSGVRLSTNLVVVEIAHAEAEPPLEITISEQSAWLVAGISELGWARDRLDERSRRVIQAALAGVYQLGGVDVVREQIETRFSPATMAYDISEAGLVLWPLRDFEQEVNYPLNERPQTYPRPRNRARQAGLVPLPLADLVFREHELEWIAWQQYWEQEQTASSPGDVLDIPVFPVK